MFANGAPPKARPCPKAGKLIGGDQAARKTKGTEFTPRNDEDVTGNVINKKTLLTLNQDEATTENSEAKLTNVVGAEANELTLPKGPDLSDKIVIENPPLPFDQGIVSDSTENYILALRENFHDLIKNFQEGIDRIIVPRGGTAPREVSVMSFVVTIAFGDVDQVFKLTCADKNPAIHSSAEKGMTDCGTHNCKVEYLGNGCEASADGMEDKKGIAEEKGQS